MFVLRASSWSLVLALAACASRSGTEAGAPTEETPAEDSPVESASEPAPETTEPTEDPAVADVLAVEVTGEPGGYSFAVTLRSPDTGCEQYANWWEVLDAEGALLHRRILAHSHVDEQPFTRSGSPVAAEADAVLWVRAHMHGEAASADGYGGQVLRGTPAGGFEPAADEAPPLHELPPLPDGCAF